MDPQQKQLLQCVYRALEDAGIPMEDASGTRTGVFFGMVTCRKDGVFGGVIALSSSSFYRHGD